MKFEAHFIEAMYYEENPDTNIIEDEIVDTSRWSVQHEVIFGYGDKCYRVCLDIGATENQPNKFYDSDGREVHQVEKTIKVWEVV